MKRLLLIIPLLMCLAAAPPKITWVAVGDSITYLNDHLDETGGRMTKGFLTLISEKYPDVSYVNQGHNGWTAIDRKSVVEGKSVSVRVDLGGGRIIKKKNKKE